MKERAGDAGRTARSRSVLSQETFFMRITLLLPLLLVPRLLCAQPAPDAPVARHVSHLLELARDDFRAVRGEVTYGPGTSFTTTVLASRHAMRFRGHDVASGLRVNANWNVLHVSTLPVDAEREALPGIMAALADSVAAVMPAGWQEFRLPGARPHATWMECPGAGGGRQVTLEAALPFERPGFYLIVYNFARPCPRAQAEPRPSPDVADLRIHSDPRCPRDEYVEAVVEDRDGNAVEITA
jgi:hypothetical protein